MLNTPLPDLLTLTTVLAYMGLAAALGVAAGALLLLFRPRKRGSALIYLGMAALFGFTLVSVLVRAAGGVICYRPVWQTVLLYGGLIALHLYFLWDIYQALRAGDPYPCERNGGGGE